MKHGTGNIIYVVVNITSLIVSSHMNVTSDYSFMDTTILKSNEDGFEEMTIQTPEENPRMPVFYLGWRVWGSRPIASATKVLCLPYLQRER